MSNIVELKSRPVVIVESVVARLEEMLADARAGKITAVAIAAVASDGASTQSWSEGDDFGEMLGAVARLQHRLNVAQDRVQDDA